MTTDALTQLLRGALVPTLAVGVVVAAVAGVWIGALGLLSAILGVVLVVAFFAASILALRAVRNAEPAIFFALALTVFALKVLALALVFVAVERTGLADDVIHRGSLAAAVIGASLVWIAAETRAFVRLRTPLYDLDRTDRPESAEGTSAT